MHLEVVAPPPVESDEPADQEPIKSLSAALDASHPLAFLDTMSTVWTALDPRSRSPFEAKLVRRRHQLPVADVEFLSLAPEVLRALIRYAHHQRGIPASPTTETIDAVGMHETEFARTIRTERHQGPMALLERMGAIPPMGDQGPVRGASEPHTLS